MFLVGIFSTHITYIILALVYIFGYGTYALNQKKHTAVIEDNSKTIIAGENNSIADDSKNFYYQDDCIDYYALEIQGPKIKHPDCSISIKLKPCDTKEWTSYKTSLPNTTRPSPILS